MSKRASVGGSGGPDTTLANTVASNSFGSHVNFHKGGHKGSPPPDPGTPPPDPGQPPTSCPGDPPPQCPGDPSCSNKNPEPGSLALIPLALAAMALVNRRRKQR